MTCEVLAHHLIKKYSILKKHLISVYALSHVTFCRRFTIFARKMCGAVRLKNFESVHRYKGNLYPLSQILTGRMNSWDDVPLNLRVGVKFIGRSEMRKV